MGIDSRAVRGRIFDIQGYSIHDGPGIRTTVFLKGCPLRCTWCQNPESQSARTERMKQPDGTVRVIGRQMTAGAVFDEVAKDDIFYRRSGGGVTLSGGEPLAQARFAEAVLKLCREAGFHTAVNTSGYGPWREVRPVFESTDLVLFDLKHLDSATHRRLTRVGNALILDNLRRVRDLGVEIWVRVPVVPGLNDDPDNLDATTEFVRRELGPQVPVFLLPYHRLGESKYAALGRPVCAIESPSAEGLAAMAGRMQAAGLTVQVGGSG